MNDTETTRIAAAINQLRPDWPAASLRTLIEQRLRDRPRRDVAIALTWVACDADTQTPARVLENGPWWKAAAVDEPEAGIRRNPKPHEVCRDHPGEYRLGCRLHAADRLAAQEETRAAMGHLTRDEALHRLREDAREAAARYQEATSE